MGLPRRHERFLDPDMQLLFPEAEPDPTASPERLRLLELDRLAERLGASGAGVLWDDALPGARRFYCEDPWGNRIELLAGS